MQERTDIVRKRLGTKSFRPKPNSRITCLHRRPVKGGGSSDGSSNFFRSGRKFDPATGVTPVAGLIFETKNRATFLERFFGRGISGAALLPYNFHPPSLFKCKRFCYVFSSRFWDLGILPHIPNSRNTSNVGRKVIFGIKSLSSLLRILR